MTETTLFFTAHSRRVSSAGVHWAETSLNDRGVTGVTGVASSDKTGQVRNTAVNASTKTASEGENLTIKEQEVAGGVAVAVAVAVAGGGAGGGEGDKGNLEELGSYWVNLGESLGNIRSLKGRRETEGG